jgi:alcohol dehydrogenase class IV
MKARVPLNEFRYSSYAQDILFGAGSVNCLREAVDRFHWDRLLLCSTGSQRRGGPIASIERALDDRLVAILILLEVRQ